MVFLPEGADASRFATKLQETVNSSAPFHLLTEVIRNSYGTGIDGRRTKPNVRLIAEAQPQSTGTAVGAALFETDAQSFLKDSDLAAEIFGPSTSLVRHGRREEVLEIAR